MWQSMRDGESFSPELWAEIGSQKKIGTAGNKLINLQEHKKSLVYSVLRGCVPTGRMPQGNTLAVKVNVILLLTDKGFSKVYGPRLGISNLHQARDCKWIL